LPPKTDCVFYCDPPYFGNFTEYAGAFSIADQQRLCGWLAALSVINCPVIASNSGSPEMIELYESFGFTTELIEVRRSVGASARTRKKEPELLAYKGF